MSKKSSPIVLQDKVADTNQKDVTMQVSLRQEIMKLPQREQLLLHYRYDMGMKQEQIAQRLNVSQVQVSRMERKVLAKLKNRLVNT